MIDVCQNFDDVQQAVLSAYDSYHLNGKPHAKTIVVTKKHMAERFAPLLERGHRVFAENRVQEAQEKWPPLKERYPDIELHLIGALQTNKVKEAVALFDVIQTVDRPKLAKALSEEMRKQQRQLSCLIQVNTGEEPQKAGVLPGEADQFITECKTEHGLDIKGLMCIPPVGGNPALHFGLLRQIAAHHALPELSMGMSGDYQVAVAMGATYIRVGSAILGERQG